MIKSIYVIYVAGPFRAKPIPGQTQPNQWAQEQNIRRAEAIALDVWKRGHAAVCPHTNTRYYQGACPDDIWLNGDLAIVEKCDGVLLTPDWVQSTGAVQEKYHCEENGIPFSTNLDDLIDQISMRKISANKSLEVERLQGKIQALKYELESVKPMQAKLQGQIAHLEKQVNDWRLHTNRREDEFAGEYDKQQKEIKDLQEKVTAVMIQLDAQEKVNLKQSELITCLRDQLSPPPPTPSADAEF
jgi:hypothetical protein